MRVSYAPHVRVWRLRDMSGQNGYTKSFGVVTKHLVSNSCPECAMQNLTPMSYRKGFRKWLNGCFASASGEGDLSIVTSAAVMDEQCRGCIVC